MYIIFTIFEKAEPHLKQLDMEILLLVDYCTIDYGLL